MALIVALGAVGDPRAVRQLLAAARERGAPAARDAAIVAMGRIGTDSAVEALLPLLVAPDPATRRMVLEALADADRPSAVDRLRIAAESDSAPDIRKLAGELLRRPHVAVFRKER